MLIFKQFNSSLELLEFVRGTSIVDARTGTNAAANTTFTDAAGTPFAAVQVNDVLHISGDATPHTVTGVTDDNNIEVTPAIATQHAGPGNFARYRILRGGNPVSGFEVGPWGDPTRSLFWGIYDVVDFG